MAENGQILSVKGVCKNFGGIKALSKLNLEVKKGQIHGIIGPNGAGKSTFFNVVSGIMPKTSGEIYLKGTDITNLPAERIFSLGLSRTFQKGRLVGGMTVLDNVMSGLYNYNNTSALRSFFLHPFKNHTREKEIKERALESLEFVGMLEAAYRWTGELVWVERQLVQIARAMISQPEILLLDEPTSGMGVKETEEVEKIIRRIREMGVTVVVVSHDVSLVMRLCDWVTAIVFGEKLSEGPPEKIQNDPRVLEAYIGE